jgi:hypothetical protein
VSRLIGLYPRHWRTRYEDEFRALMEDRPPTFVERFDIVRSAVDAHMHPQVPGSTERPPTPPPLPEADLRLARRLGFGAVAGAIAWVAAFIVVSIGPIRYDEAGAYRDGGAGLPVLFLAVVLLSAGLGGQLVALPRDARLARAGAGGAIPFLLLWGLGPWLLPLMLVVVAGLIALAVGARRSGAWLTGPSVVMIGCCLAVVAVTWYGVATSYGDRMAGGVFLLVGAAVLIPAWLVIGGTLIRRPGEAPRPG